MIRIDGDGEEGARLRRAYGARNGTLIIVRPDGHIGFRGGTQDWNVLERYLDALHGRPVAANDDGPKKSGVCHIAGFSVVMMSEPTEGMLL